MHNRSTRPAMICAVCMLATPLADRAVSLPPRAFALTNDREIAGPTDIDDGRAALRTGSRYRRNAFRGTLPLGRHVTSARPETHLGNSELRGCRLQRRLARQTRR